ncbi:hypothetical protein ANCDUO_11115 [Ancylostoma duodenale]|uniref:Uncharacterized protein n=1 Tax=Ancylostoma duodenale TaxID=51022 RepID=A0A0C2GC75_9BILA|nr:hypothetical protein ANCDUO_11115 [Ancylostoma duodenale]
MEIPFSTHVTQVLAITVVKKVTSRTIVRNRGNRATNASIVKERATSRVIVHSRVGQGMKALEEALVELILEMFAEEVCMSRTA